MRERCLGAAACAPNLTLLARLTHCAALALLLPQVYGLDDNSIGFLDLVYRRRLQVRRAAGGGGGGAVTGGRLP